MIVYLDASALVKRYVAERGSRETADLCAKADIVATSLLSRAQVAAALAKAVRLGIVEPDKGRKAQRAFVSQWADFAKVPGGGGARGAGRSPRLGRRVARI